MPRPLRVCPAGSIFHVLNRANSRNQIFNQSFDYQKFIKIVNEALSKYPTKVLAFCLMPNHWHFLMQPTADDELSKIMAWIGNTHTRRYRVVNQTFGVGPLYQGRFKSFPIKSDEHLDIVKQYIECNPVRARLVRRPEEWAWSSAGQDFHDIPRIPIWREKEFDATDWLRRLNTPQTDRELDRIRKSAQRGIPFGDEAWSFYTAQRLGLDSTLRPNHRPVKRFDKGS